MKTVVPTKWPLSRSFLASILGVGMGETRKTTNSILEGYICLNGNPTSSTEQGQSTKQGNGEKMSKIYGLDCDLKPFRDIMTQSIAYASWFITLFWSKKEMRCFLSVSVVHREYPNTPPISHFSLFFPVTCSKNTCEFPFQIMSHRLYMG